MQRTNPEQTSSAPSYNACKDQWKPQWHETNDRDKNRTTKALKRNIFIGTTVPKLGQDLHAKSKQSDYLLKLKGSTFSNDYTVYGLPYDYTVEVRNRFKWLDLIDRLPDELWTEVCDIVQEAGMKTIPKKKKCKKGKMAVWGGLTNSCEKKRSEKQRRKRKIYPFECRVPKNSKER